MEKRREKRIAEENRVVIEYRSDDPKSDKMEDSYALTKDVSIGGARIVTDRLIPVGTTIRIKLTLSRSRQIVTLDGEVKWVEVLSEDELFEVGVEFLHEVSKTVLSLITHLYGNEHGIPSSVRSEGSET